MYTHTHRERERERERETDRHTCTYIYKTVKGTTASARPSWRESCTGADTTLKRRVSSVVKTLVQKKEFSNVSALVYLLHEATMEL
jgi:hypothetical protein